MTLFEDIDNFLKLYVNVEGQSCNKTKNSIKTLVETGLVTEKNMEVDVISKDGGYMNTIRLQVFADDSILNQLIPYGFTIKENCLDLNDDSMQLISQLFHEL